MSIHGRLDVRLAVAVSAFLQNEQAPLRGKGALFGLMRLEIESDVGIIIRFASGVDLCAGGVCIPGADIVAVHKDLHA